MSPAKGRYLLNIEGCADPATLEAVLGAVSSLKILPTWLSARLTVNNTLKIVIELDGGDSSLAERLREHAAASGCVIDISDARLTHRAQVMI